MPEIEPDKIEVIIEFPAFALLPIHTFIYAMYYKEEPEPVKQTYEANSEKYKVVEEEEKIVEVTNPRKERKSCWITPLCCPPLDWYFSKEVLSPISFFETASFQT